MSEAIDKRYEFVLFFDVENGNPNGDPDAANMPRIDTESNLGIVTDVCLKRKIRNYVDLVRGGEPPYDIYVRESSVLNAQHQKAYDAYALKSESKKLPKKEEDAQKVTGFMCQNFFDIRTFGAVMTTEVNCGQVRGPVQINFARSLDPIAQQEVTITRMAVTKEADKDKERTMGRKYIVPYGLYRVEGYVSAKLAEKTGFSQDDLELLWESLINLFEHDHSAARGKMASQKLYVFEHETVLGNAPSHKLFDLITHSLKEDNGAPRLPRCFTDYNIHVAREHLPAGVQLLEKL